MVNISTTNNKLVIKRNQKLEIRIYLIEDNTGKSINPYCLYRFNEASGEILDTDFFNKNDIRLLRRFKRLLNKCKNVINKFLEEKI